jgi:hypothetical protein
MPSRKKNTSFDQRNTPVSNRQERNKRSERAFRLARIFAKREEELENAQDALRPFRYEVYKRFLNQLASIINPVVGLNAKPRKLEVAIDKLEDIVSNVHDRGADHMLTEIAEEVAVVMFENLIHDEQGPKSTKYFDENGKVKPFTISMLTENRGEGQSVFPFEKDGLSEPDPDELFQSSDAYRRYGPPGIFQALKRVMLAYAKHDEEVDLETIDEEESTNERRSETCKR